MSSNSYLATPTRPWQEPLLAAQFQVNRDLVILCTRQQQLILQFEKRLATREERKHPSFEVSGTTSDDSKETKKTPIFNPTSEPVIWEGNINDAIPIDIDGEKFSAMIFTSDFMKKCNETLKSYRKICQLIVLQRYSRLQAETWEEGIREYRHRYGGRETDPDNEHIAELRKKTKFETQRVVALQEISDRILDQEIYFPLQEVCCRIRHFLESQGALEEDDNAWLEDLRKGDSEIISTVKTPEYDAKICPFEDNERWIE